MYFFLVSRDVESQLNEMRRPLLNQMVELWKTMGLTHLQEARIDPMLGYFKGKYLCTLHPLCFISNRSKEACTKYSLFFRILVLIFLGGQWNNSSLLLKYILEFLDFF